MTSPQFISESNLISQAIAQLRCCTQVDIQANWQVWAESDIPAVTNLHHPHWCRCELNAKGHIAWAQGKNVLWLAQKLIVPQDLQGYLLEGLSLRLVLTWWAESAQIYVNHQLVQEGDLFDCSTRVLLSPAVTPGQEIVVTLRLVSPNHDHGALVRSLCVYEFSDENRLEPGFIADEFAVLHKYLETFAPERLVTLAAAMVKIDWSALPDREKFERSLLQVRDSLQCFSHELKQRQIYLLGHAHLDLAWLWSINETWEAAQRTFTSVLNLQAAFPELIFCHSSPALYAWIEQHRPDLFAAIQQQVKAGRWEITAGLWVEPELNLIDGESIVRQVLYGQRYVMEKFDSLSKIAWLPDTFGFCATLPQIFQQGGIEYFVTQKLRWNDTTQFPYGAFWWRSPDGTEIFSYMSAPIGEGIDPVKMAAYACDWETQTNLRASLWLPGVGDHGGGPTRDMLEVAQRWQKSPFFPQLEFTTAENYLQNIVQTQDTNNVQTQYLASHPTWNDELYLEFHRGCYTTHADQKRWNRRCEQLLYQAELFASLAKLSAGMTYPQEQLETVWKQVLFNQFHDILPGSSIPEVYLEADSIWQEVEQAGTKILQESLTAIASQIALPNPPHPQAQAIVVFNPLNWERSQIVEVLLSEYEKGREQITVNWQISDLEGQEIPSQIRFDDLEKPVFTILFLANDIPAVGYRVFWLSPNQPVSNSCTDAIARVSTPHSTNFVLENEYLRVTVEPSTGDLSSVFDKTNQREVLSGAGNQLQAFQDGGQYWDAWNIDPNYAQHPLAVRVLKMSFQEQGTLRTCIRVERTIGKSQFWQDYILEKGSPVLKIKTTVNWQERSVLVKAAFPLAWEADDATYEIPCGAITRPTKPQTTAEKAKWEVPALRWADLSVDGYGVSLLNDCKYGYDSQPNQLRLTLLRSPSWPNPEADRGYHEFTYALYPHAGDWRSAHTVRRGYELNVPLQVLRLPASSHTSGDLPPVSRLLDLSAQNLILLAFKQSEDDPQQFVLRCYECEGEAAQLSLQSDLSLSLVCPINLLEQPIANADSFVEQQKFNISPRKIATFMVKATQEIAKNDDF